MNICMYVLYAHICVCMYLSVYPCMYIGMHVIIHICMHAFSSWVLSGLGRGSVLFGRGNCPGGELSGGEMSVPHIY